MRGLKLCVLLAFFLFSLLIFGNRLIERAVSGQDSAGTALAAPTAVSASDNQYANKVGIHWDTISGATAYRIYRNTVNDSGAATEVGSTAANYYFDTTPVSGQVYFFWVKAENSQTVSGFSAPDQGVRAFGKDIPGPFPPLAPPIAPAGNEMTAAKASLGKTLFWDEQLSATKTVSCGTCHRPSEGGADPRTSATNPRTHNPGFDNVINTADDIFGSPGVPRNKADGTYSVSELFGFAEQVTGRRSPSYLNAGYSTTGLFWDGRASDVFRDPITQAIVLGSHASLESQVLGPPTSAVEMGHTTSNWTGVASRVAASSPLALATNIPAGLRTWIDGRTYPQLFQEAFGTTDVTPARIAMAIATHERTLFSDQTPLDRDQANIEPLTQPEASGRDLFIELRCNFCHSGSLLTENGFHNIGVRPVAEDLGRAAITGNANDNAAFRTPGLRNVELHAPYMHNGRFATLEEVIEFYNRGGDHDAPNINRNLMRPLNLSVTDKADLLAFMKRPMTDVRVRDELPPFDRPRLYTESNRVPVVSGTGRSGSGGIVPNAIVIEPPLMGNPSFTVAVSNGLGNAQAVVVIDSADPGVGTTIPSTGSFARVLTNLSGIGSGNGFGSVNLSIPNNPALVGQTFYGRWYITDDSAANGIAVSQLFRFMIFAGNGQAVNRRAPYDFDGDGKTDVGVYRPTSGEWWYRRSLDSQISAWRFGSSEDKIAPVDFTGDGKADIAVWRPSSGDWYVIGSGGTGFYGFRFGQNGDIPAPADFDGDGKADAAVFRPSDGAWYILQSGGGVRFAQFGAPGDVPVAADYDGDGRADIAIYRPSAGQWWVQRSTAGLLAVQFGISTDKPVQGDYTGDGKADIAVWRPGTGEWFVLASENGGFFGFPFGTAGDIASPGDYDGDGKMDAAVFRPSASTWYINRTTAGIEYVALGNAGDTPVASAFIP